MSNWTFCRSPHNEILYALWWKTTLQNDFVAMKLVLWVYNFKSRCQIEPFAAVLTMQSCLLFDWKLLFKMTVAMKLVLWVISSPDVKLNLLPQSSQWNPVCSLIQNYSSKWLCGDETSLVSNFKSRCQIEPFAAVLTMKSYLLFDSKLLFKMALWW